LRVAAQVVGWLGNRMGRQCQQHGGEHWVASELRFLIEHGFLRIAWWHGFKSTVDGERSTNLPPAQFLSR
jgi:hypothetical protein